MGDSLLITLWQTSPEDFERVRIGRRSEKVIIDEEVDIPSAPTAYPLRVP
jgi:hypothetical protein